MEIKEFFKIKIKFKRSESPIKTYKNLVVYYFDLSNQTQVMKI